MTRRKPHSKRWKAAAIGLVVSSATLFVTWNDLYEGLESRTYDFWFRLRGPQTPNPVVVIAAFDNLAARELGDPPWSRERCARLIDFFRDAGARQVLLDLRMTSPDPTSAQHDERLRKSMSRAGNVLLPLIFDEVEQPGASPALLDQLPVHCEYLTPSRQSLNRVNHALLPYAPLLKASAGVGHINIYPERDGVVRRAPMIVDLDGKPYPSLGLQSVRMLTSDSETIRVEPNRFLFIDDSRISIDVGSEVLLNYAGGYRTFPYYSAFDILDGRIQPQKFKDKVVIVGSTAAQLSNFFPTPFTQVYPGVEIQATVIDNLLENRTIERAPRALNLLILLLIGPMLGLVLADQRPTYSWMYALTVAAAIAVTVFYFFTTRLIWIDVVRPLNALFWTYAIVLVYRLRLGEKETARTQSIIETVMQVSNIVGSSLEQSRLLDMFLDWITQMVNAEASSVLLFDDSRERLLFAAATGPRSETIRHYHLMVGEGIAGWVAQHGTPVISNNVSEDVRFKSEIGDEIDFQARSIICVPVQTKKGLLGVIEVINKKDGSPFTRDDQDLLVAFGNQAGVMLENARLYNLLEAKVELANQRLIETNQQLSVEKGKLEAIVRSMAEALIVLDASRQVVFSNPAAARILQCEGDELLIGRAASELIRQDDLLQGIEKAYELRTEITIKELRVDDDAVRIYSAHLAPVQEENLLEVAGVVVVFNDITELKELDRAKSDFVSFVSHEMRSPITAIKGFASTLLRKDMTDRNTQIEFLRIIAQECDRMTRLIASILDLSRIEAGRALELRYDQVNLVNMLESVVDRHRLYASGHEFSLSVDGSLTSVTADPDKLEQILINLVGNAVKYSPNGGAVKVEAHLQDGNAIVSISDHGIGIEQSQLGALFQRYRRIAGKETDRIVGTGLGLYLTRHLVVAHGGRIDAVSEPGIGSTFTFSIPVAHSIRDPGPGDKGTILD
ncbi:MAG: hypothetical protein AUJ92_19000 [Armatimonadetes bacterium CG2_30_59_28]|nr:MAG: hypothetical protein AUJ92_19000 [Armatimonadetes bacterium CG2_30_59_28]PIX38611.1 MAG: hypothetical protein COZ56_19920 [Armatimonadetes bacterium CG_4_8_14_3_um_filter_58_9]